MPYMKRNPDTDGVLFSADMFEGAIETSLTIDDAGDYTWLEGGATPVLDTAKAMSSIFKKFTAKTSEYIQAHIDAHNAANNVSFDDINTFPKYAMNPDSVHYVVANKYIIWIDLIWIAVRSLTVEPTDEEFKALLNAVVF